ncbi:MAG: lipopolysaccharide biosynthesis protein [Mangrovibacterium sp.]
MSSIRKSIGTGIFYTAAAKYSNIIISLIITAILARLLTPSEYGIVAIVMVFITFFTYLADFGLGPAIIQNKELDKKDIESIFSVSLLIAGTLSLLFYFSAGLISRFYDNAELLNIARWLSLSVLIFTINVVPSALNKKELKFKQLGIISVVVQILAGIVAVVMAFMGFSYYALIFRAILSGLFLFIGSYYLNPVRISFHIRWTSIVKIWRFSTYQFLFNFINYFSRNTDNLLIGKYFGSAMLGFYDKAFSLMLMPVQNLTHVITPVLHPVLSDYQDRKDKIYQSFLTLTRVLTTIGFPLSVILYFSGKEIIYLFYGDQWTQSIPVFQVLAVIVGVEILLSSTGSFFQSANRADLLFISGVLTSSLIVLGVLYGIFIGKSLMSVAVGLVVARLLNFFLAIYLLVKRALGFSVLKFTVKLLPPLFISALVLIANLLFRQITIDQIYLALAFKLLISFAAFVAGFICFEENRKLIRNLMGGIMNRIRSHSKLAATFTKIF